MRLLEPGQRIGKLTISHVVVQAPQLNIQIVQARCDCGRETRKTYQQLQQPDLQQCGPCFWRTGR